MDERGQSTLESLMIAAAAFAIVAAGLAGFKDRQPQRWDELAAAVSDVSRDLSWQLDDAVSAWKGGGLRASLAAAEVPRPDGRAAYLRPALDPLEQVRGLR